MYLLKKLTRLHRVLAMIKKKNNQSTQQKNMHMKQAKIQYDKKNKLNATI